MSDRAIRALLIANADKLKQVVLQEQGTLSKETFDQLARCSKLETLRIEKCNDFPVLWLLTVLKNTNIKELSVPGMFDIESALMRNKKWEVIDDVGLVNELLLGLKEMTPTNCESLLSLQQFQRLNIASPSLDSSVMLPLQFQKGLTHLYLGAVKDLSVPSIQGLLFALQFLVR